MKQFKAEWQEPDARDLSGVHTVVIKTVGHIITQHNAMCDHLEENQWQRDNIYAEGFNDGAYQQRTVGETKRLQPVYGDKYWFITDYGAVKSNTETEQPRDKWRYKIGNYYTEKQAREALLKLTE
jgi:hypothetical protein